MFKILLIEDDQADQLIFKRNIKKCGIKNELVIYSSISDGKSALKRQEFDFVFCDFNLPDGSAINILETVQAQEGTPIIVLTSQGDIKKATESLKSGAFDYITKDNINSASLERIINNVSRSISERNKRNELELELAANNANTRAILDNTTDGIWSLDKNNKILIINNIAVENFRQHNNYSPEIGDDFFVHLKPLYNKVFKPLFDRALTGLNSTSVSEHNDLNYTYYLEVSSSPILENKVVTGVTFFARSVTKRVEGEKKLQEAKKLAEDTSLFKSKFLANMSHEIRTPMNAMLGFSDLLLDTKLNQEQRDYTEIIQRSGDDLLVIVNDILDLTKIQAGKMDLRLESYNLKESLQRIIFLHQIKIKEKGNELVLTTNKSIPEWIIADHTRVSQILNNLISNSNKFTENGKVELSVSTINKSEGAAFLQFSIKDTGIGIPEEELKHIFEEFSQVDSSLQRTTQGTGLGLSIVANLVHLMNGTIKVKSQLGIGSEFLVHIPLEIGTPKLLNNQLDELNKELLEGKKLLVCEDIELNRILAKKVLDTFDCEVFFAENGKEGVEMMKSINPDLVIMDIQMPIMNGYEATKKIREFSNVPIIAMTAHLLDEEKEKCQLSGMNGFIPKPFKKQDILEQLGMALNPDLEKPFVPKNKWELLNMPTLQNLANQDESFVLEIFDVFLETAEDRAKAYSSALLNDNPKEETQIAHIFRSSFSTFDLNELHNLSLKIEQKNAHRDEKDLFVKLIYEAIDLIKKKKQLFS